VRRSPASQRSTYQLQTGGTSPLTEPAPGIADPQPRPSGVSIRTPMLAITAGAVRPSIVISRQRRPRAKTSGRPVLGLTIAV
jgi:hypothetical protein